MVIKEAHVLYDARGKKSQVLLPYKKWEEIIELIEDAFDSKAMDDVDKEKSIPWEEAKRKLRKRSR
jgi:hypothetical protein